MELLGRRRGVREQENQLIGRINDWYLISRKSHEIIDEEQGRPLTTKPEIRGMTMDSLESMGVKIHPDIKKRYLQNETINPREIDEVLGWDIFWAQERTAARNIIAYHGRYERYLPGRFLHHDLLAHDIASLYNGHNGNSIAGKKVLELGSGSGLSLIRLAQKGANVTGLDYSVMAIEFAKYLADHFKVDNVDFIKSNYLNTEFPDGEFDIVYNDGVLEHEKEPELLLREMARLTKNGGYILIGIPNESSRFYGRFKDNESTMKKIFSSLLGIPVEHRRYDHNIRRLIEDTNQFTYVKQNGIQIAPSSPIRTGDIQTEDLRYFDENLPATKPTSIDHTVRIWSSLELLAEPSMRIRYGWSVYDVAQKDIPRQKVA